MFSNIHLVPDHITYSGRQWSSSSKGPGHSRSYSSSERSWQDTYWEKDIGSDGLNSASHDIPMTVSKAMMMHRYNVPTSTSSITLGTMGLSMAETLAQGPPRSHSPQVCLMLNSILSCLLKCFQNFSTLMVYFSLQLSASTQKLEELALKQSRLLIPVTPSTPRSLVRGFFYLFFLNYVKS